MPKRKSTGPTNRDLGFGINHGSNGKGSKTRVTDPKKYAENFSEINWGVKVVKGEFVKTSAPRRRKSAAFAHKDVPNNLVHEDVDTIAKQINSGEFTWDQGERV